MKLVNALIKLFYGFIFLPFTLLYMFLMFHVPNSALHVPQFLNQELLTSSECLKSKNPGLKIILISCITLPSWETKLKDC